MKKIISLFLIILVLVCSIPFSASAEYKTKGFEVKSETALLVSLDTGDVLYAKNADKKCFPASITKIMTAIILLENCNDLNTEVIVTKENVESLFGTDLTVAGFVPEEKVTLDICLNTLMVNSSADSANVIVDYVETQTGKNFIDLMNKKAKSLGMNNTNYVNATGIHHENHYTTANDLVKLCTYAIGIPNLIEICSQAVYYIPKTNKHDKRMVVTTNFLINIATTMYYPYVKGIKTGYTEAAGRCVASTASKDGYNYLCIVLGGDNLTRTEFSDSKNLYQWAFDNFEYRTVADTQTMLAEMDVDLSSQTDFVQLYPEKNVTVIIPKEISNDSIIYDPVLNQNSVWAPVKTGQVLGYVSIKCAGQEIAKVNLVSNYDIDRNFGLYILEIGKNLVTSTWFLVIIICLAIVLGVLISLNIASNKRKRARLRRVRKIKKL